LLKPSSATGEIGIDRVGGVPGALVVILRTVSTLAMTSTLVLALSAELSLREKNMVPLTRARRKVERRILADTIAICAVLNLYLMVVF